MDNVLHLIWTGIFMGLGYEISLFLLWLVWRLTHRRLSRKVEEDHWINFIHEYFK